MNRVLEKGLRTGDMMSEGCTPVGCRAMGDAHLRGNLSAHEQSMPVWRILFFSPACFWGKYKELGDEPRPLRYLAQGRGSPFLLAARRCTACLFPFCPPCRAGRRQSLPYS